MKKETRGRLINFIVAIIIPLAVGGASAFLTRESMDIYKDIKVPPLSPPSFLFPVVWTVLYVLMGISSAMIWQRRSKDKDNAENALIIYAVSLFFNFVWSLIFFNFRAYLLAFVWLMILLTLIVLTVITYRRIYPPAAYLQLPYILWVLFAGYLNFGIYILNG